MRESSASARTVFITGATGGLGKAVVLHMAELGWHVFAADLDGDPLRALARRRAITAVPLDVCDPAGIEAARQRVAGACDGLDGVVNFAGVLEVGSLVELDPAAVARVLDVNVLGTVRVNHALFPLVLARKGRIVNISSETGWQSGMPFNGPYAMSKHAIEAYSDALRRELMFLGVRVIKIQPGPFRTAMVSGVEQRFERAARESTHFGALLARLAHATAREQAHAHDPALLARVVARALTERAPRSTWSVKPDPLRSAMQRLPAAALDALLKRVLGG
jgi:NAD(P)-dependent dehydrogenase (short-subunit alcohol dehydrogenase family)